MLVGPLPRDRKLPRNVVRIQILLRKGCGKSNKPSDEVLFQEILHGLQLRVHTYLPDSGASQGKPSGTWIGKDGLTCLDKNWYIEIGM